MGKKLLSEEEMAKVESLMDDPDEVGEYLLKKGVSPYVIHLFHLVWLEIEAIREEFEGHRHREVTVDKIVPGE